MKYKLVFDVHEMHVDDMADDNLFVHPKSQIVIEVTKKELEGAVAFAKEKLPDISQETIRVMKRAMIEEMIAAATFTMTRSMANAILDHAEKKFAT